MEWPSLWPSDKEVQAASLFAVCAMEIFIYLFIHFGKHFLCS